MLVETEQTRQSAANEPSERVRIVRVVLDEIRPNLERDGGNCEFIAIDGNKVMIQLTGACVYCRLASATLEGIQTRLIARLGEFVRLIPVVGPAKARQ